MTNMRKGQSSPHIGILHYHGALLSAVYGLTDQFTVANTIAQRHAQTAAPVLRVSHWQVGAPAKRGAAPMRCSYDSGAPSGAQVPSILIIPPSIQEDPLAGVDMEAIGAWLRAHHARGATLGSVCAGSFLLAEAGLLQGRPATTHWQYAERMAKAYPDTLIDADRLLIEDGDIITAGGMMAWTDLGLRIVHRHLGPTIMMETARFMLVDPPGREQRYYSSFAPRLDHGDAAILKVQHWLQKNGARQVAVSMLADKAALEPRTFLRRFHKATGLKPVEYCQHVRVGKAREMLEFTRQSAERIAYAVGYEDTAAFRKIFHRLTGLTPGEYRGRFGQV